MATSKDKTEIILFESIGSFVLQIIDK